MPHTSDVVKDVLVAEGGECAEILDVAERRDSAGMSMGIERCEGKKRSSLVAAKVGWRRKVSWGKEGGEEVEIVTTGRVNCECDGRGPGLSVGRQKLVTYREAESRDRLHFTACQSRLPSDSNRQLLHLNPLLYLRCT